MQKKIPFLGHYVSEAGIETDPKKVETIKNWPQIDSVKKLRAFLGLAGYYRKFIKGYAQIALPLSNLLKSDVPFQWTQDQEEAKKALSEAITQSPILQKLDFTQPMTLTTDASDKALGAVLSQNDRPIAFLSKTFSQTECNWPIYEKEMFAVIYTLHKWEHWLLGVDLTIITDNSALSHIQNQPKLVAKQARWIQFLEQFNYKMVHRPGAENKVADGISRQDIYGITIVDNQQWLERIRNLTEKIEKPTKMEEHNGLLYKNNRLYIPGYQDVKMTIIQENHDGIAGHLGYKKTLAKVTKSYYWEKMAPDIKKFVDTCEACQRSKGSTQKQFGTLNPIAPPSDKFEAYSMDFIGPLPKSKKGNNGILVIVDMFTKAVCLEPIKMIYDAQIIA